MVSLESFPRLLYRLVALHKELSRYSHKICLSLAEIRKWQYQSVHLHQEISRHASKRIFLSRSCQFFRIDSWLNRKKCSAACEGNKMLVWWTVAKCCIDQWLCTESHDIHQFFSTGLFKVAAYALMPLHKEISRHAHKQSLCPEGFRIAFASKRGSAQRNMTSHTETFFSAESFRR